MIAAFLGQCGLGVLRLLLAVAVVLTHAGGVFGYRILPANVAVEAFFIVSGFLMGLVLDTRYDPRGDRWLFYSNRALRIFPTYFMVLLFALVVYALIAPVGGSYYQLLSAQLADLPWWQAVAFLASTLFIVGQDAFLFLVRNADGWAWSATGIDAQVWPLNTLPPAWSISLELVFYLLVPFLVRLGTRWLLLLLALSLTARLLAYAAGLGFDPWTYRFFPFELAWFLAGLLAYRHRATLAALPFLALHPVAVVLGATLLGHPLQAALTRLGLSDTLMPLLYLALVTATLPALFEATRRSSKDARLGELSYPLYLVHWPVITAAATLMPAEGVIAIPARTLLCLAVSLGLAWLLVIGLERPLSALRRRRRLAG